MKIQVLEGQLAGLKAQQEAENYVSRFEDLLTSFAELGDPSSIEILCSAFDDIHPFDELMYSVIHAIEAFPDAIYVEHLLKASEKLCIENPRWASIVFIRAINAPPTRRELITQLRSAPLNTRKAIADLMFKINGIDPKFIPLTLAIIVAAT